MIYKIFKGKYKEKWREGQNITQTVWENEREATEDEKHTLKMGEDGQVYEMSLRLRFPSEVELSAPHDLYQYPLA